MIGRQPDKHAMKHYRAVTQRAGELATQHRPYDTTAECLAYLDGRYPMRDPDPDEQGRYRVEQDTLAWIETENSQ
jgi:hypothetical protein